MQGGLVRRKLSVRPYVCLPVCQRVHCDKAEERSVQNFIPYERSFSLVLLEEDGWAVVNLGRWLTDLETLFALCGT